VQVSVKDIKTAMEKISAAGILDSRRKVLQRNGFTEIPVTGNVPGYKTIRQQEPEFYWRTLSLTDLVEEKMTEEQLRLLPKGWYILGDVIIVKIHPALEDHKGVIGDALLAIYPRCKSVLRDFGINGQFRKPKRELIAGSGSETVHKENGVRFKLDAMRLMFSPGNLYERMRMAQFGQDETVVDMFAGVGYFTLPMAVHSRPKRVIAIELNPLAHSYLKENIRLNKVEDIVEPVLGDCSNKVEHGVADRVVMGYVGCTDEYLGAGIEALRFGGHLHYHQTLPARLAPASLGEDVINASQKLGREAEILRCARVKKYAPGVIHAVVDARIS
jgi:tRNA wybutosine-synthesizing protein 2